MSHRTSHQIRQDFFNFFKNKEHLIVDSAPVVPQNDATLLFINAGMNPFKPIFLDEEKGFSKEGKLWQRVANTQKCIRVSGKHNDLEEVGHDTYHHTLFEMLGNWSFGDYFKKEAIAWAWELLTGVWGLEPDRLYATVFEGDEEDGLPADEEAGTLWASETPIPRDHIMKFGKKDNFWEMGDTGPCGPCSEVHIDLRPDAERKKEPGGALVNRDDPRVMEIWNLVFIQFNRQKSGKLVPLPAQHVDTGMGFERIVAVLQNKQSNYDTDIFMPLIEKIAKRAETAYGKSVEADIAMRVIADHIRAAAFAIGDGAMPSNEERGYVIRRILRRASRYAWDRLEIRKPFMHELVNVLSAQFENVFHELTEKKSHIINVIRAEEASFLRTLDQGIAHFNQMAKSLSANASQNKTESRQLSGEDAFKLHDTYGFPIDLTELMARERGISVDMEGFRSRMEEQKKRAREAGKFKADDDKESLFTDFFSNLPDVAPIFTGYEEKVTNCKIIASGEINKKPVLLLDRSPFYAESGGQVADTGTLKNLKYDMCINVLDVQMIEGKRIHFVDNLPPHTKGEWVASIDAPRRHEIERHHSATHLLHAALREELGKHVSQKGSLVAPGRLRFDFSHYESVKPEQLDRIEERVNEKIRENIKVQEEREASLEDAKKRGAMMLFGEKYGEKVRVITVDPEYSVELCGGTHVRATGEIGYFRFLSESSVAAGIRRVEALAGSVSDLHLRKEKKILQNIYQLLGKENDPDEELMRLLQEKKNLEKNLEKMNFLKASLKLDALFATPETAKGDIRLIAGEIEGADMNMLKQLGYEGLEKANKKAIIILGAREAGKEKACLVAAVTPDLVKEGFKAGELIGNLAKIIGGGGGGQPNLATAGGKNPAKLPEVFLKAKEILSS